MSALIALPSTNHEVGVMQAIEQAHAWLVEIQRRDDIDAAQAALAHAQMATIAEATKRLGMDKENLINAEENVRRSEFVKARAIRRGQAEGTIATRGNPNLVHGTELASPSDFGSSGELYDRPSQRKIGILSFADEATPGQFDAALAEAKADGNLSRAEGGFEVPVLMGVAQVLARYSLEVDNDRLIQKLAGVRNGWKGLVQRANVIRASHGVTVNEAAAAAVVEFYNSGRGGVKLMTWWSEAA